MNNARAVVTRWQVAAELVHRTTTRVTLPGQPVVIWCERDAEFADLDGRPNDTDRNAMSDLWLTDDGPAPAT